MESGHSTRRQAGPTPTAPDGAAAYFQPPFYPLTMRQQRSRIWQPLALVVLAVTLAACAGGSAGPTSSNLAPTESGAPAGSGGTGACVAAPAPPADQTGWRSVQTAPTVFPVIVNSSGSLTCGLNRLLFTFLDDQNRPVAQPDRAVAFSLFNLGRSGDSATQSATGAFVWGIENERGFYVASVSFAEAGVWGVEFTTSVAGGDAETIRMTFDVATSSPVVRVGDPAPASDTPTADSVGGDLRKLSTDQKPDPSLYRTSPKVALAAHQPFVLIFATPKFCASAQCGPTLDRIKPLAAAYPTVAFINVEPYALVFQDGSLVPALDAQGNLQPVPAVFEWGLLSEPWVFVVDRDGIVAASFEGIVATEEVRAAAEAVQ